jgi:hypothetical protein
MVRLILSIDEPGGEQVGDGESELIDLPDDERPVKALAFLAWLPLEWHLVDL